VIGSAFNSTIHFKAEKTISDTLIISSQNASDEWGSSDRRTELFRLSASLFAGGNTSARKRAVVTGSKRLFMTLPNTSGRLHLVKSARGQSVGTAPLPGQVFFSRPPVRPANLTENFLSGPLMFTGCGFLSKSFSSNDSRRLPLVCSLNLLNIRSDF